MRPQPRATHPVRRWRLGLVMLTVLAAGTGCGSASTPSSDQSGRHSDDQTLGHVHGLGVDPGDGALYIASHFGVFRHDDETGLTRVADRWQDTMAFTVIGPGHFLASGHPDLREDLPAQLGLIESTDAARTWRPLSLQGRADFHALEPAGNVLFGYEALSGTLRVTTDHKEWDVLDTQPIVDLAADSSTSRLWATTDEGQLLEYRLSGSLREPLPVVRRNAPPLVFVEADPGGAVVGVAVDGTVYRSEDQAETWQQVGTLRGEPHAFALTDGRWVAATTFGVQASSDQGRTWTVLEGTG